MNKKNFTITYNEVMDSIEDPNAQLVFHWLCRFRNSINNICCPSLNTLSRKAKLSKSSIQRSLKYLKVSDIVKVEKKTGRSNKYIITNSPEQFLLKPVYKLSTTMVTETPTMVTLTTQSGHTDHVTRLINNNNKTTTSPLPHSKGESDVDVVFFYFYKGIVEKYNSALGHVLRNASTDPTEKRKKLIKDRGTKLKTIDDWRKYFWQIAKTSFLLGNGKGGFKADFDWLIEEENFTKIIEGKYETNAEKSSILELELLDMIKEKRMAGYDIDPEVESMYAMK